MDLEVSAATDVGRKRERNEDSMLEDRALGLFVVCDGMGGHAAGEVASARAIEAVRAIVAAGLGAVPSAPIEAARDAMASLMRRAVDEANRAVHALGRESHARRGAGTTCTALLLRDGLAALAHVGDSRLYLARRDRINQVSHDHTFVAEGLRRGMIRPEDAKDHPHGSVLIKAVGTQAKVEVDTLVFDVLPGDVLLLCSDGLHGYFEDPRELHQHLIGALPGTAERLIAVANERGGKDNVTAVAIRIAPPRQASSELARRASEVQEAFDAVRHIVLFSDLSHPELLALLELLKTETRQAGDLLVEERTASEAMYVLASGRAEVLRKGQKIAELHAGSHFGEMALLTQRGRSASVRALEPCRLLVLGREAFGKLLATHPLIGVKFLWRLAQVQSLRLDDASELLAQPASPAAVEANGPATLPLGAMPAPFRR
ncbi:MAG: cyclic nucleotide-binding domain-containing protein [Polyangiaceae bacterium]|nr:cyclic nucleotide-binding domain-containing protein [Polyangiaceae bacterium]